MIGDREVVVTGMGVVTPIGIGIEQFWESLVAGRSGVRIREEFVDCPWPLKMYAPVMDFDGRQYVKPRKAMKVMCGPIQFGYAAATMALEQAGLAESDVDADRVGTVFGTETFFSDPGIVGEVFHRCMEDGRYEHDRWGGTAMKNIEPLWMLKYLPNMVTSHISIAADARGPSNSICQAEASGALALIEAAELIARGDCDVVVTGGTGSQTSISALLYRGQHLLSSRIEDPESACRPFERDRDGTIFGEGAGAIVLESAAHASGRGAETLASIKSWSRTFHLASSGPLRDSIAWCVDRVLQNSNLELNQLSHVSAQANGQIEPDVEEAHAIRSTCGDVPVWAMKSNFGYVGPAAPTVELIGSIESLQQQVIPATINHQQTDERCPINVNAETISSDKSAALKIAYSANGQVAAVLVGL